MSSPTKKILIFGLIIAVGVLIWQSRAKSDNIDSQTENNQTAEPQDTIVSLDIVPNATYGVLMADASISPAISSAIFQAAEPIYDLSRIREGRTLDLIYDHQTDEFKKLVYQIDSEEELIVNRHTTTTASSTETFWTAERVPIQYEIEVVTDEGMVETSMYQAALDGGIDERAIIELANAFQWSVDFALDPRVGDTFKFIYEKRYRDGEYIGPGKILAGKYVNDGTPYYTFYFAETEENTGFFDQEGNSVQKIFLKAPVAFRYISSGFTTGARYVAAFNVSTGHRAIDYAAALGTPIRSVGDGTVTFAGWSSAGYGYLTTIRHNGTYSTNYAHQSKIAVRVGQKVKQGETIGYVGSTGFSTGPHLHYEMVKNGVKVNPLTEVLPPGEAIKDENRDRFFEAINPLLKQLNQ